MELGMEGQLQGGGGTLENEQLRWDDVRAVSVPLLSEFRNTYSGTIIAVPVYCSGLGGCDIESQLRQRACGKYCAIWPDGEPLKRYCDVRSKVT